MKIPKNATCNCGKRSSTEIIFKSGKTQMRKGEFGHETNKLIFETVVTECIVKSSPREYPAFWPKFLVSLGN